MYSTVKLVSSNKNAEDKLTKKPLVELEISLSKLKKKKKKSIYIYTHTSTLHRYIASLPTLMHYFTFWV